MWESEADGQQWFEQNVAPNLPPGIVPNRTFYPLHTAPPDMTRRHRLRVAERL
jgi:hypothetical protein